MIVAIPEKILINRYPAADLQPYRCFIQKGNIVFARLTVIRNLFL